MYGAGQLGPKPAPVANLPEKATVTVVTARKPINRGQTIRMEDLTTTVLTGAPPSGVIMSPSAAIGRTALADMPAGQLVMGPMVATDPAAAGLAHLVPTGQRAISLLTTDESGVANLLIPGDRVDVQAVLSESVVAKRGAQGASDLSEALTLLQNLEVLAVGARMSAAPAEGEEEKPAQSGRNRTVTVAMTPEQTTAFVLARSLGPYYLTLRNPGDTAASEVPGRARLPDIRSGKAGPAPAPARVAWRRTAAAPSSVELVVGGQSQVIYPEAGQ